MTSADRLHRLIESVLPRLESIPDSEAAAKTGERWSRKEEIGHLIDSASNNHLRFVRAALEPEFHGPPYDQNGSVALHGYQQMNWADLLEFWRRYNDLLVRVVARIPEDHLQKRCQVGDGPVVTLGFLIDDYVRHLQHHVDHILGMSTSSVA